MSSDELNRIKDEIGPLTPAQDVEVLAAIERNPDGVLALAQRVAADPKAHSRAAVFLSNLRRGHDATPGRQVKAPQTALERAHALFTGKYRSLPAEWDARKRRMVAVDYALQECGAWADALIAVEQQLRRELDAERRDDDPDYERDTPYRRMIRETYGARS